MSNLQGKIHTKKKDSDKSVHNNRQKAKASKGKAPDIQNYSQIELDHSSEADSEVQRLYFQEIENRKGLKQQGVVFGQEDYIQTLKSLQKKPVQFQQETYVPKIENKGKDILNTPAKAQSIGFITLSRIPIHIQYITSI